MRWAALLLLLLSGASAPGGAPEPAAALLVRAEALTGRQEYAASNHLLARLNRLRPGDPEVLWRAARNEFLLAENLPVEDTRGRLKHHERMIRLCRQGLAIRPDHPELLLWLGAGIARRATTLGLIRAFLTRRIDPAQVERMWRRVIALNPTYRAPGGQNSTLADAHFGLAQLYREIPDHWLARLLTGVRGGIDRALVEMRLALAREPARIDYLKELGVELLCRYQRRGEPGDLAAGRRALARLATMPSQKRIDDIDKEHARWLAEKPELACGYNRDGVEELSHGAMERERAALGRGG